MDQTTWTVEWEDKAGRRRRKTGVPHHRVEDESAELWSRGMGCIVVRREGTGMGVPASTAADVAYNDATVAAPPARPSLWGLGRSAVAS